MILIRPCGHPRTAANSCSGGPGRCVHVTGPIISRTEGSGERQQVVEASLRRLRASERYKKRQKSGCKVKEDKPISRRQHGEGGGFVSRG